MIEINIKDDFNLDQITDSGQCFRWTKVDEHTYGIPHRDHHLFIEDLGEGNYRLSCSEEEFKDIWYDYFDLGENYRKIRRKIRKKDDAFLYKACQYGQGIRILRQDPWETLICFIVSQNKNIPAIRKSVEYLCRAGGKKALDSRGNSYYLFPSPKEMLALDQDQLAGCKLGYRCKYVRAAAEFVAGQEDLLERLCEEENEPAVEKLTEIHGVGVKVASCVSLFGLHHVDAFPVDVWVRRILENEYPGGYPMEKYAPYNGIYQQYMFYYYREHYGK